MANGTATTAAAVVAMKAKRMGPTLQVENWLLSSPSRFWDAAALAGGCALAANSG
jgi:hypothetical protein